MLMKKNKSSELTQEIQKITQDYEKLAKEQKDRILMLREENRTGSMTKRTRCHIQHLSSRRAGQPTIDRSGKTTQRTNYRGCLS